MKVAKKTKDELLAESYELGLNLDPESDYSDVLAAVKDARESSTPTPDAEEIAADDEEELIVDEAPREAPVSRGGYPFDALGNYIGR